MITYIVCCHDEPYQLTCLLYSLKCQTNGNFEVIVTDRDSSPNNAAHQKLIVERMYDKRFSYTFTKAPDIYSAAEEAAPKAKGDFLCFPSADGYYVPGFTQVMLDTAKEQNADLVYCDMLYDPRMFGVYDVLDVAPQTYRIDKTGFIVKKEWLLKIPFPGKEPAPGRTPSDGLFIEELIKAGIRHAKAPGVLVVHN